MKKINLVTFSLAVFLTFSGLISLIYAVTINPTDNYYGGSGKGDASATYSLPQFRGGSGRGEVAVGMSSDVTLGYSSASTLSFTISPSNASASVTFTPQPVVKILDALSNVVGSATNTVTLRIETDGGSNSTLGGTTSMDAVSGIADFTGKGLNIDKVGTSFKLGADSSGLISAISSPFNITSAIIITSPNGGETWPVSTSKTITWNAFAGSGPYTVKYSTDQGNAIWTTISNNVTKVVGSAQSASWVTPPNSSTYCKVRVSDNNNSSFTDDSDNTFNLTGGFTILTPNGGEIWSANNPHTIYWQTTGTVPNVKLSYSITGDTGWADIIASTSNSSQYSWTPTNAAASASARIRVMDASDSNVFDSSDANYTLQKIAVISPTESSRWLAGSFYEITWVSVGIGNVAIDWSTDDFATVGGIITPSTSAGTGVYSWDVPSNFTASTNVKIRIKSTSPDTDNYYAQAISSAFAVYGQFSITAPALSTQWAANEAHNIVWTTNRGVIPNVKVAYSSDGFVLDNNTIIASTSNTGIYSWIPTAVGSSMQVRISDVNDVNTYANSPVFSVTGFGITAPVSQAVWRVGDNPTISWSSTGSISNVKIEYWTGTAWETVVANTANTGTYSLWTVPDIVTAQAKIRITDLGGSGTSGTSATFNIAPKFTISSPSVSDIWGVGESKTITWTTSGTTDKVKIEYYNGSAWQTLSNSYSNNGNGISTSYTWASVPDAITDSAKIRIIDVGSGDRLAGVSNEISFKIKSVFAITSPTSATHWLANSPQILSWTKTGTVSNVKLEYATLADSYASWTTIATSSPSVTNSYAWTVADVLTDPQNTPDQTVKIRISDADSGHPPAILTSDPFTVSWEKVRFLVSTPGGDYIAGLKAVCGTWNQSSLDSPAGPGDLAINSTWYYFKYSPSLYFIQFEKVVGSDTKTKTQAFSTDLNPDWNNVTVSSYKSDQKVGVSFDLETEQVKFDTVHVTFNYDTLNDKVYIYAWLERVGKIQTANDLALNDGAIEISDSSSALIKTLTANGPGSNGIYTFTWDVSSGVNRESSYLGKATITVGGTSYTTSQIFYLGEAYQAKLDATFRNTTAASFSDVVSRLASINTDVKTTIPGQLSTINTNLAAAAGNITSVLQDTGTTIPNNLASIEGQVVTQGASAAIERETAKGVKSKIIDMDKNIEFGNPVSIKYKTLTGMTPVIDIYNPNNNLVLSGQKMTEIGSTGIYEYKVPFYQEWGAGEFTVICSEATKNSMDSILLNVQSPETKADTASLIKKIDNIGDGLNKIISKGLAKRGGIKAGPELGYEKQIKELGENSGYQSLARTIVNPTGAGTVAGVEGEGVGAGAASDADYQNYIKQLQVVTDLLKELIQKKSDQPVVKTWYEQGSIKIKMVAVNPSETDKQTVTVESYLPKEIVPADIIKLSDLNLVFDYDKSLYKVFKEVTLAPKETKVFEIEMNDIWQIPADESKTYKDHVDEMENILAKGEYAKLARELAESIKQRIARIEESQINTINKPEEHIAVYRANKNVMTSINLDVLTLEKLVSQTGNQLKNSIVKKIDPSLLLAITEEDTNEMRDIKLFLAVSNPSGVEKEVDIKRYLPKGIAKDNVIDAGGLSIFYDPEKELYYLNKEVKLKSKEDLTFQIKIKDIWFVSGRIVDNLRQHTRKLVDQLSDTEYEAVATRVFNDINAKLKSIIKSQDDTMEKIDEHIATFYLNQERLDQIKDEILRLERMVLSVGGNIEYFSNVTKIAKYSKGRDFKDTLRQLFKMEAPKKGTSWKIIFIIIGFLGVISFLFYILWWMQIKKKTK